MAHTLKLDKSAWDLTLDGAGRIAVSTDAYGVAQNVACAVRRFTKDTYFNRQDGVPHFQLELGSMPPEALVRSRVNRAARAVPEVAEASTTISRLEARRLEGDITITTTNGETVHVAL